MRPLRFHARPRGSKRLTGLGQDLGAGARGGQGEKSFKQDIGLKSVFRCGARISRLKALNQQERTACVESNACVGVYPNALLDATLRMGPNLGIGFAARARARSHAWEIAHRPQHVRATPAADSRPPNEQSQAVRKRFPFGSKDK